MSDPNRPVLEDDLHAYIDGRLDPARQAEVEAALARNPALRARVTAWRAQAQELREALAFRLAEPVPARLSLSRLTEQRLARRRPGWQMAAAVVLALGLGTAGGWTLRGPGGPTEIARLSMEAASAHLVFAEDPAHGVEVNAADRAVLVQWASRTMGRKVTLPDLSPFGYRLLGGRMLSAMYGPATMLVYADAAGNRLTVYVQPMKRGEPAPMRPVLVRSVGGYAWIKNKVGCSVLADGETETLHAMANTIRDGLEL
ncbi:MAG TPA: anti-sigma factor [Roseomonas sp.]|nr:anti-sigma factor [Roseomonas sp.]